MTNPAEADKATDERGKVPKASDDDLATSENGATAGVADEEETSNSAEHGKTKIRDRGDPDVPEPMQKKPKGREWMSFKGVKHSRVGDDFQVAKFPSPSDFKKDETRAQPEKEEDPETVSKSSEGEE